MKTLYLIRHAKSDWSDPAQSDFNRPLNHRGEKNAPFMGKRLAHASVIPDLIVSSPALRARLTAMAIADQVGYNTDTIRYEESLYLADAETIEQIIRTLPDSVQTVFLVGHNPGLTLFAEAVSAHEVDNIPTCGIFAVTQESETWKSVRKGSMRFASFDYPKKHTS